ncbi:MAG TPA: SNF2-related protein [Solirubrobacteraceae bacterium]|nr:SNF2-related protein [Solirubrobacteraceae bacterium]
MAENDRLALSYSDNTRLTVGDRLAAEIESDPSRLWVASGYFAPSLWRAVGPALEQVQEFRLLLGKDFELANLERGHEESRIADLVLQAIRHETEAGEEGSGEARRPQLRRRDEAEHVAALVAFLERHAQRGAPVVKLWEGAGFLHAKAYILRGSVGIGSANFTGGGLTRNRELVGWRQDRQPVAEVAEWFEGYWQHELARDYTAELIAALRATPLVSDQYTPYDVLIKALAERYGIERPPSLDQAAFTLKWFQEDAAFRVIQLLNRRGRGALLADAVGLGKTYVAMAVINHYLYTHAEARRGRGRPVLLVVPRSLEEMWRRELEEKGLLWACEIVTMQRLRSDFDAAAHAGADLVVIDEAHRLRGGGTWFRKAIDLVRAGERPEDKRVLLLTATPVNTGIADLVNLLRVLTKNQRAVWAPEIADFERYLKRVERGEADPFPVLDRSLVRRSRSDILRALEEARAAGQQVQEVRLPERRLAHVDHDYGGRDDLFETFAHALRSLVLVPYDLERFRKDEREPHGQLQLRDSNGEVIDQEDRDIAIRPGSLAALCAVGLLVRFQSSLAAIRRSLRRLDAVMSRFGEALALDPPRLLDLQGSPEVRRLLERESQLPDRDEGEEPEAGDPLDEAWEEALARMPALADAEGHDLTQIRAALKQDRRIVAELLASLPSEEEDGKVAALIEALARDPRDSRKGAPGLAGRKALIFTQFRDTARYLSGRLAAAGHPNLLVEGSVAPERRAELVAWFDPDRHDAYAMAARARGEEEPLLLISTDVLAEGHNLQLAEAVINYDLHFNPQRAVQRAGRVDRLESPHRVVHLISFLPPEPLERHIGLLARLDERFRRIHGLGLGDEQVMPLAADRQAQTLEQIRRLYADEASVLDELERTWTLGSTDYMRHPLEAFLARAGAEKVHSIPLGVSSVKRLPHGWRHGAGAFIALAAPRGPEGMRETHWRFYPRTPGGRWGAAVTDEVEIFRAITAREGEPRAEPQWSSAGPTVIDWALLQRAARELAEALTRERSTAQIAAGASERSRRMRSELRAGLEGLAIEGADELLERLLQVRVEDFDGRSGWRSFDEARRSLRRAESLGERREAAVRVVEQGLELLGAPVQEGATDIGPVEVGPEDIRLVAYEDLVEAPGTVPEPRALTDASLFD